MCTFIPLPCSIVNFIQHLLAKDIKEKKWYSCNGYVCNNLAKVTHKGAVIEVRGSIPGLAARILEIGYLLLLSRDMAKILF